MCLKYWQVETCCDSYIISFDTECHLLCPLFDKPDRQPHTHAHIYKYTQTVNFKYINEADRLINEWHG